MKAVKPTQHGPEAEAYRGRQHAVAALAFDTTANLETVAEHLSAFLQAFCPPEGLRVRAGRGTRSEILPARFTRTAKMSAKQLGRGGTLEMAHKELEPVLGRCQNPLFWVASEPASEMDGPDEERPVLRFGVCIARPTAQAQEHALAHALGTFVEACVALEGCVSAVLTAQGPPLTLAAPSLAYEALAGTAKASSRVAWLRTHVRSPGWRVLLPPDPAKTLAKRAKLPPGVTTERVRSGFLARHEAPTPWAMTELDAMEAWLKPRLAP